MFPLDSRVHRWKFCLSTLLIMSTPTLVNVVSHQCGLKKAKLHGLQLGWRYPQIFQVPPKIKVPPVKMLSPVPPSTWCPPNFRASCWWPRRRMLRVGFHKVLWANDYVDHSSKSLFLIFQRYWMFYFLWTYPSSFYLFCIEWNPQMIRNYR